MFLLHNSDFASGQSVQLVHQHVDLLISCLYCALERLLLVQGLGLGNCIARPSLPSCRSAAWHRRQVVQRSFFKPWLGWVLWGEPAGRVNVSELSV